MAVYKEESGRWICTACGCSNWVAPVEGDVMVYLSPDGSPEPDDDFSGSVRVDISQTKCADCYCPFEAEL